MAEIDRLTVVWDANFKQLDAKLNKVIRSNYGAAAKVEKGWKQANDNMAKTFAKGGLTQALDGLSARAPAAASGLDALGPAGLGAAAGLGALALAAGRAREAMQFGDTLQTAADRLGLTAEAMQELQFAAYETDVAQEALEASLHKLNGTIGAFKTGVGDTRVKDAFKILGITPQDLEGVRNANDLLPVLADRLGTVGTTAEQVQIARRLGIDDLLPMLRLGADGLDEVRQRARDLGLVLSNDTVKALAEADRKMELAGQQIQMNLRAAFSGLAVDIADATSRLASFINQLRETPVALRVVAGALAEFSMKGGLFNPGAAVSAATGGVKRYRAEQAARAMGLRLDGNGGVLLDGLVAPEGFKPDAQSVEGFDRLDKGGDQAAKAKAEMERQRRIQREIYQAQLAELDIHNNSGRAAEDRLTFGLQRLNMERAQLKLELSQRDDLSAAQKAQLEQLEMAVLAGRERNLRDEVAREQTEARLEHLRRLADHDLEALSSAAYAAQTAQERLALERQLLVETRRLGRERLERELALNRELDPTQKAAQLDAYDRATGAAVRGFDQSVQNGMRDQFRAAFHDGVRAAAEGGLGGVMDMLADRFKTRLIDNLADGLFNILASSGRGGGGQNPLASLMKFAGFFAGGGTIPRGQWGIVGERGPEAAMATANGIRVISNSRLQAAGGVQAKGGATIVHQHFPANFQGAVVTEDLIADFKGYADRMGALATARGGALGAAQAQARLSRRASRSL